MLFWNLAGRCEAPWRVPRSRHAIWFFVPVLTCATGSDIFSTNHMFPNPVVPFTYPPTSLSLKLKNSFPENVFLEGSTFRLYRSAHVHSWQFLERTCFNDASIRLDTLVHRYKKSQRREFVECPAFWTKKRNRPAKTLSRRSTLWRLFRKQKHSKIQCISGVLMLQAILFRVQISMYHATSQNRLLSTLQVVY